MPWPHISQSVYHGTTVPESPRSQLKCRFLRSTPGVLSQHLLKVDSLKNVFECLLSQFSNIDKWRENNIKQCYLKCCAVILISRSRILWGLVRFVKSDPRPDLLNENLWGGTQKSAFNKPSRRFGWPPPPPSGSSMGIKNYRVSIVRFSSCHCVQSVCLLSQFAASCVILEQI